MDEIEHRLAEKVAQLPDWLRHDLSSKDTPTRKRAEEALAAILSASLKAIE
ncbi:hypothetical protein [Sphingomonas crocodyli]|uniref:hypothetical protein n=1 Tax=Sphingomonas crocodyli TaxID=1979270 RepID=UPI0013E3558F|nr:hypothetical protein [Sphingomonas crocodyli]